MNLHRSFACFRSVAVGVLALGLFSPVRAQTGLPGTGLVFDEATYRSTPYKATFTAETYANLPRRASIERHAPTPGDQGQYGTCVAFAVGYHMRTIIYGIEKNIAERAVLNRKPFPPTFIYERIKNPSDHDCQQGSNPILALELLENEGAPTLATVPYRCGGTLGSAAMLEALGYPILDYQTLFAPDEPSAEVRINTTKKPWPTAGRSSSVSRPSRASTPPARSGDACQSAGALKDIAVRGAVEERAIAQLARSTGTHWLTATGSEQFATEFAKLGHGAFTKVLLDALNGAADAADGIVTVN